MRRITHAMISFRNNPEDPSRIISASKRARRDRHHRARTGRDAARHLRLSAAEGAAGGAGHRGRQESSTISATSWPARSSPPTGLRRSRIRSCSGWRRGWWPRIDRAVALATNTLRYGRADESPPAAPAPARWQPDCRRSRRSGAGQCAGQGVRVRQAIDADLDDRCRSRAALSHPPQSAAQCRRGCGRSAALCRVSAARKRGHVSDRHCRRRHGHSRGRRPRACSSPSPAPRGRAARGWAWRSAAIWRAPMAATSRWSRPGRRHALPHRHSRPGRSLTMAWDPKTYLKFGAERTRPAGELLARVAVEAPSRVADLGCGPGNSTALLAARWPDAQIDGIDNSREMLEDARKSGVNAQWVLGDVAHWTPDCALRRPVFQCDAAMDRRSSRAAAAADGLCGAGRRAGHAGAGQFRRALPHADPRCGEGQELGRRNSKAFGTGIMCWRRKTISMCWSRRPPSIDIWETTYCQVLEGEDAVFHWMSGTGLRPFAAALEGAARAEFLAIYRGCAARVPIRCGQAGSRFIRSSACSSWRGLSAERFCSGYSLSGYASVTLQGGRANFFSGARARGRG